MMKWFDPDEPERLEQMRRAVLAYLNKKYGPGDMTWHPLYVAVKDYWRDQMVDNLKRRKHAHPKGNR